VPEILFVFFAFVCCVAIGVIHGRCMHRDLIKEGERKWQLYRRKSKSSA